MMGLFLFLALADELEGRKGKDRRVNLNFTAKDKKLLAENRFDEFFKF